MIFTMNGPSLQHATRRAALALCASAGAALVLLLAGCDRPAGNSAYNPRAALATDIRNSGEPNATQATAHIKVVIGLDDNFPPMGFRDEKNALVGFDIDLAREAAKRLGAQVEFKPIDWSAKEAELNGHRVDALWNGLTITEERKKNIAFTSPYLENRQIIVIASESPIKTKADLAGKTVGVQDGSTAVDAVERDTATARSLKDLKKFSDNVTALMDLKTGRLDAVVVDEVVGRYYLTRKPGEYRVLDDNFGTEQYGVGVRKDDTALLAGLQNALDKMKHDGAAAAISGKWFGKDIIVK